MKTKNAFALRDFDGERILQRNFFVQICKGAVHETGTNDKNMHKSTDANYLDFKDVRNMAQADSAQMVEQIAELQKIKVAVSDYTNRILRHEFKLGQFIRQCEGDDKYRRANILRECYCEAIGLLGKLQKEINLVIREGEKKIQKAFCEETGKRIIEARNNLGLTRLDVANRLGLSQNALGQYERGEREISLWTLKRLSALLSQTPNRLLGFTT